MLRSKRLSLFCVALATFCSIGVSADCDFEALSKYSSECASAILSDLNGCPEECKKYLEVRPTLCVFGVARVGFEARASSKICFDINIL